MKTELQPAFVLHLRPYRNTSALVEAYTAAHGRVGLVARGARAPNSRLRGALQPFRRLLLSWSGGGELVTLTGAEEVGPFLTLAAGQVASGFYLNELLLRLTQRNDPHPEAFAAYAAALEQLARGGDNEAVLRVFEKRLLEGLGYGLPLRPAGAAALDPDADYLYVPESGPVPLGSEAQSGVRVAGATLIALAEERLEQQEALRQCKVLMRTVLAHYLGDRPLRSRELFRKL